MSRYSIEIPSPRSYSSKQVGEYMVFLEVNEHWVQSVGYNYSYTFYKYPALHGCAGVVRNIEFYKDFYLPIPGLSSDVFFDRFEDMEDSIKAFFQDIVDQEYSAGFIMPDPNCDESLSDVI